MGILLVGGETLQIVMRLPLSSIMVLQGMILFFVLGGEFFRKYRIRSVKDDDAVPLQAAPSGEEK